MNEETFYGSPFRAGPTDLAAALAKAQAVFPPISRERTVKVKLKTGGEYQFKYAPLDVILAAVRPALAANGLSVTQLIDGQDLVTMLLHSSGGTLSARAPLMVQSGATVQEFGSAITYLRRYSLQAILGIASEEDDDGNAASGNRATPVAKADDDAATNGLIGTAQKGTGRSDDFETRLTPDGPRVAFRLKDSARGGWLVVAVGPLAELIQQNRPAIEGQTVTCWGGFEDGEPFKKEGRTITWRYLALTRLKVGALDLTAPEPDEDEGPTEAELAELGELFPVSA